VRGGLLAIGCGVVAFATSAGAQGAPERRELLTRAEAASRAGQHAEALALGEAAGRMQMTPSVRMFLAEEHEALAAGEAPGRHLLDAVDAAAACVREANAQRALNHRDWILTRCTALLQRLNARIARVRVVVAAGAPAGTALRLDDRALDAAEWNTPLEVLPGERVVEARAPGGAVFRQTLRLAAGGSATVTVAFADAAGGAGDGGARGGGEPTPVWPRVVGWSLVGVGAVGLAVSAWQWASTRGYGDDSLNGTGELGGAWARYANRVAPPDALGVRAISIDEGCARARADAATDADARGAASLCDAHGQARALAIAFGVGGAALAVAGAVVVAVAPRARAARVAVAPVVGAGLGGVVVGGAF
jgi:hypothetical protein